MNKLALKRYYHLIKYSYRFPRDIFFCLIKFKKWDTSWRFYRLPIIQIHKKASVEIGANFVACSSPYYNSIGVIQKVTIKALTPKSILKIGSNVGVSGATISCCLEIKIGDNVLIGSGALISDSDAHAINYIYRDDPTKTQCKAISIESDVFIGARSIILKGVTLGMGAVVGAGSVVTNNVEPFSIVVGNPAKKVGDVREERYL
jgi:acetyltransferase-like isoleucine patch superfamily enzyme